jgi:hypothetical protein
MSSPNHGNSRESRCRALNSKHRDWVMAPPSNEVSAQGVLSLSYVDGPLSAPCISLDSTFSTDPPYGA